MLSKKERLSRQEFNRFFSLGKHTHSPYFTIVFTKYDALHASVVVSNKISGSAVVRNKVRRRVYECVRNQARAYGTIGVFIFILKKGVEAIPYSTLRQEIENKMNTVLK